MQESEPLAVVGSPSTNAHLRLDLLAAATEEALVGQLIYVRHQMREGTELALGTVTEVTTSNKWHSDPTLQGVIKDHGEIPGMTGVQGDIRTAEVRMQAVYREDRANERFTQSGPTLRMSPSTGAHVRKVTEDVVDRLVANTENLHYIGHLHGTDIPAPMNLRDFSTSRGAWHSAILGTSGSGKTSMAEYVLASQMRHQRMGLIIIDPQGQWASETDMPFSLQGWATEMGREVIVRRVSEDLRLDKDAPLFGELLSKTRFLKELMKMSAETADLLTDEMVKVLRGITGWDEMGSEALLEQLLRAMQAPHVLRNIYADQTRKERLLLALAEVLGEAPQNDSEGAPAVPGQYVLPSPEIMAQRRREVLTQFLPLHNLFSPTNPGGGRRHSLWGTIQSVFNPDASRPAPVVILDMSTAAGVSWLHDAIADEDQRDLMDAIRILDDDAIKAAILRRTCSTLKNASEDAFRGGRNLNTLVVFDEAWRYAAPPSRTDIPEIAALSADLAGYARDTRKFGIGWMYITQEARGLNNEIWSQLSVRVVGYGLVGADLAKVGETLDSPDQVSLYRAFPPPDALSPRVYPFMITGPVSPLSFTKAPLFVAAPTDFDEFRRQNATWIEQIRLSLGLQVVSGPPAAPRRRAAVAARPSAPSPGGHRTAKDLERVRQNAATGGVDPANATGLSADAGFSSSLSAIDDAEPPF